MNDLPRQKLKEIIIQHGRSLCDNPEYCEAFLRDWLMNDLPRQKLKEIIIEHGRSLCNNPQRCEAFLNDYRGEYKRDLVLIISALKQAAAKDLLNFNYINIELLVGRLIKKIQNDLGLTQEAAHCTDKSLDQVLDKMVQLITFVENVLSNEESIALDHKKAALDREKETLLLEGKISSLSVKSQQIEEIKGQTREINERTGKILASLDSLLTEVNLAAPEDGDEHNYG
jgi:hypothetical protein